MRPLVEKSALPTPAKSSGLDLGFKKLGDVLKGKKESPMTNGSAVKNNGHHQTVNLETVEVDGVIKSIIVQCSCGEVIEIDCSY
ncbi:MAG: hypothetical protein AB3N63_12350 [Puniceicoccaceae bacterium]